MSRGSRIHYIALTATAAVFVGCPVDDRRLHGNEQAGEAGEASAGMSNMTGGMGGEGPTMAGEGGSSGSKGGGEGGEPSGGTGGATAGTSGSGGSAGGGGGQAGEGGSFGTGGCGDLNHNDVLDCQETLVANPRFDVDLTGWEVDPTLEQDWDERNAWQGDVSGALSVVNDTVVEEMGFTMGGSRQCLPATGGVTYQFAALIFVPGGQGPGDASMNLGFFAADDCAAFPLTAANSTPVIAVDAWQLSSGSVKAPAGTRSMFVRLVATKPYEEPPLEALFDNVLVRAK
jgi:hypothetical protein